jgi:hypothetical protein
MFGHIRLQMVASAGLDWGWLDGGVLQPIASWPAVPAVNISLRHETARITLV